VEFICEIIYRFGVPNKIIADNRTQFTMREFRGFCADVGIRINYALVSHLQRNEIVERSNGMILWGLKPRIFDRLKPYARKWIKELPSVLWALCTAPSLGHRAHTIFTNIRLWGNVTHRGWAKVFPTPAVFWRAIKWLPSWWLNQIGENAWSSSHSVSKTPIGDEAISCTQHKLSQLQSWGFGPTNNSND
jgi:hypothetical protein